MKGGLLQLRIDSASSNLTLPESFSHQHLTLVGYQITFEAGATHTLTEFGVNIPWLEGSHHSAGVNNTNLTLPINRGDITTDRHGLNWMLFADRIPNQFTVKVFNADGSAATFGGGNGLSYIDIWFNMTNTY